MFDIVPQSYVRRGGVLTRALGRLLFRLWGWKFTGRLPDVPKVVVAVAPHTTNWDFILGVLVLWSLDVKVSFLGKHTLFKGLFGKWMRSIGGIPVDRNAAHGVVGEAVAAIRAAEQMVFALSPEGTRKLDKGFKTGFLHIAHGAQIPILLAYFDFEHKTVGFGPLIETTGDTAADLRRVIEFYRPIHGKYPKAWQQEAPAGG
ncbi:MAG TPA: 1-acyl-sn-glycerol-3-phosphate acyltransferase [Usitatibacteraceae bacterium]|nr:1-acyl-sn-glycerol-3-phosphate acyltransferase [Usitatibacteraceae bacterium]